MPVLEYLPPACSSTLSGPRQLFTCHPAPALHAQLSCEFATLDISDAIGLKRFNLTKTVRKQPITEDMQKAGQVRAGGRCPQRCVAVHARCRSVAGDAASWLPC